MPLYKIDQNPQRFNEGAVLYLTELQAKKRKWGVKKVEGKEVEGRGRYEVAMLPRMSVKFVTFKKGEVIGLPSLPKGLASNLSEVSSDPSGKEEASNPPLGDEADSGGSEGVSSSEEDRAEAIRAAYAKFFEGEDSPKVKAMSEAVGFKTTRKEMDAALWEEVEDEGEGEGEDEEEDEE